jgi:predicted NAD/FAD-dependent oxidoreductase
MRRRCKCSAVHALLVAIIVLVLGTDCKEDVCERVAIIGAGIGGGAVAYYSSQLSNCTQLRVYESRDYIGGRLKHTHIAGNVIELGGDAWSTANEYVVELVKALIG